MFDIQIRDFIDESTSKILLELSENANKKKNVCLLYSMGKDCLAAWKWLLDQGYDVFPIYFETVKMDFTDKYIESHEKFFGEKIEIIKNITNIIAMDHGFGTGALKKKYKIPKNYSDIMTKDHCIKNDCFVVVDGLRAGDSLRRRMMFANIGPYNKKQNLFSPLWNLSIGGVMKIIKTEKIPLPENYKWFERSIELAHPDEMHEIKNRYPNDYQKILKMFPRVELFARKGDKEINLDKYDGVCFTDGTQHEIRKKKKPKKKKIFD